MAQPQPVGRPFKLTPELHKAIVQAVQVGLGYVQACQRLGIGEATAHQWRRRGQGTDGRRSTPALVQLAYDVQKAQVDNELRLVEQILQAARGGTVLRETTTTYRDGRVVVEKVYTRPEWTASAWILERTYPDRWGRRDRLDLRATIEEAAVQISTEYNVPPQELLARGQRRLALVDHKRLSADKEE